MDMEYVRSRITELRIQRGISEYQLSYEAGHSRNYIHNIVAGHSQPSLKELFYIIEILGVTPKDFFDDKKVNKNPILVQEIVRELENMSDKDLEAVLSVVKLLKDKDM